MELIFILLVILPAALVVVAGAVRSWTGLRTWPSQAEDLVAALGPQAIVEGASVHALWHGSRVVVHRLRLGPHTGLLQIEIRAEGVPRDIVLRSPRLEGRRCEQNAYATGDPFFDRNVIMEGPEDTLYACLNADSRRLAVVALTGKLAADVAGGICRRTVTYRGGFDPFALANELVPPAQLMQRLALGPGGVRAGLVEQLLHDPQAAVRVSCLEALFRFHPQSAEARDALTLADADKSARVRYVAAMLRGAGAEERLIELARETDTSISVRLDAVQELSRRLDPDRLVGVLGDLLAEPEREMKLAAIARLGELEIPEAAPRLVPLLDDPEPDVVASASDALARIASAGGKLATVARAAKGSEGNGQSG